MKKLLNVLVGFTIAEILIVLGVIGVVAELTIPGMMSGFEKQVTVTKLKKAYSEITQAINSAQADKGMSSGWSFYGTPVNLDATKDFAYNYFYPYIKTVKQCNFNQKGCWTENVLSLSNKTGYLKLDGSGTTNLSNILTAITSSGYSVYIWTGGQIGSNPIVEHVQIYVDIDGPTKGKGMLGRDIFRIYIPLNKGGGAATQLSATSLANATRDILINAPYTDSGDPSNTLGCSKTGQNGLGGARAGVYCGALIQLDGWKIADDYPW